MSTKHRRRLGNFLLDHGFQLRLTVTFVVVCLLLSGLFGGLFFVQMREASRVQATGVAEFDAALEQRMAQDDRMILLQMVAGTVLLTLLLTGASIVKTHHIVGPVWVVRRAMRELAAGRWPPLRGLRRADEFHGLVQDFHALVGSLKGRQDELATRLEELAAQHPEGEQAAALLALARQLRAEEWGPAEKPLPPGSEAPKAQPGNGNGKVNGVAHSPVEA